MIYELMQKYLKNHEQQIESFNKKQPNQVNKSLETSKVQILSEM